MAGLTPEMTALLAAVRDYLDITWEDAATDRKLVQLLKQGQAYINSTAGSIQDYLVEGQAQGLLFDYVRYGRSGGSEMFWPNYKPELLALRMESGVTAYAAETQDD